jgi:hypothetical protein
VVAKVLDPGGAGSGDSDLPDDDFIWADVGADVVNRPDILGRLSHRRLDTHIPDNDFLCTDLFDPLDLLRTMCQPANCLSFCS